MPRGLALLKETRGLLKMRKLSFTYSLSTQGHCKPARALKQKAVPHPQTLTLVPKPREPVLLRIWDLGQGRGWMPRAEEPHSRNDQVGKLRDLGTVRGGVALLASQVLNLRLQKKEIITITTPTAAAAFPAHEASEKVLTGTADKPCAL